MDFNIETFKNYTSSTVGRDLAMQLWDAPWEDLFVKNIEKFGVVIGTSTGTKRNRNEDRVAVAHITAFNKEQYAVAMVCDGVGGSEMGDAAATLAIAFFLEELSQVREHVPLQNLLNNLIRKTDDAVRAVLKGRGTTTASILLASSTGQFVASNIGDSRIFSWRKDKSDVVQVSTDDTLENELRNLPMASPSFLDARGLRGSLSQAIGEGGRLSKDLRVVAIEKDKLGDHGLILATDGAWKSDELGFKLIASQSSTASDTVRRALAFSGWTGGIDNVSIISIENLMKFSKDCENRAHIASDSIWLTVWICDTKVVLCEKRHVESNVRRKQNGNLDSELSRKNGKDFDKSNRKSPEKRGKSSEPTSLDQEKRQLSLTESRHLSDRSIDARPKIEISVDDDNKNK